MHSSERTIDDMMCISDNCDPHHYIKGRGMIGGMAKFNAEGQVVERKDEKNDDDEIEGITYEITDYIKSIDKDKNLTNLQKFKEIMKQVEDMNELNESTENEHEQDYINSLITYTQNILSQPKYNDFTNIDYYYKNVQGNPLFEKFQEEAKLKPLEEYEEDENINTIRGDISEDKIIEYDTDTGILEDYDGNKSTPYNSKELYGYDPEYIKKILKKNNFYIPIEIDDASPDLQKQIINTYLKFYPIDVIKDGTLWELKSFSKPTKTKGEYNYQEMQKTKIEGTPRYQILYKQLDNGDWVVGNVLDVKENKKTLPDRPNGYKYYWGYNSKDGIASANPLKSYNFRPDMDNPVVLKDGITYYKGGWNPTMTFKNDNGVNMIKITNKELKKEPRRYSYNYSKTIK